MLTKLQLMIFLIISGFYARITFVVASGQNLHQMPAHMYFNADKMSSCALDPCPAPTPPIPVPVPTPASCTCQCHCFLDPEVAPCPTCPVPSPCPTCPEEEGTVLLWIARVGLLLSSATVTYIIDGRVRDPTVQSKAPAGNKVGLIKRLRGLETQRFNQRYQVLGGLETQRFNQRWWDLLPMQTTTVTGFCNELGRENQSAVSRFFKEVVGQAFIWAMWNGRNEATFSDKKFDALRTANTIQSLSFFWCKSRCKMFRSINWLDWSCNPSRLTSMYPG